MDRIIDKQEISNARRKKWLRTAAWLVPAAAILIWGITFIGAKTVKASDLTMGKAEKGPLRTTVAASGRMVPAFEEIVNSPVSSRIIAVYAQPGDSVSAGTPLLQLDLHESETQFRNLHDSHIVKKNQLDQLRLSNRSALDELDTRIDIKEMEVNRLAITVDNERRLDSLGSGTGDRVRQAELAYNTGRLELEQMRQQLANERKVTDAGLNVKNLDINIARKNLGEMSRTLDDAQIKAPRKATLTFINDQIGQKVSEGEKIAIISDLSHFKVDGEIADAYGDRVRVGSKAVVRVGRKERMDGTISNVTPLSRNGVISFTVRLDNDADRRLRSGLRTDVYIMCDVMEDVRRIKNGSYYTGPGTYELFVFNGDNELVRRSVRLGDSNFEFVEVVDGLKEGDRVVVSDMKRFINSSSVKVK